MITARGVTIVTSGVGGMLGDVKYYYTDVKQVSVIMAMEKTYKIV